MDNTRGAQCPQDDRNWCKGQFPLPALRPIRTRPTVDATAVVRLKGSNAVLAADIAALPMLDGDRQAGVSILIDFIHHLPYDF